MNIINKLTLRHLLKNKRRTLITIIGIVLSITMITALLGFATSFQNAGKDELIQSGGNWPVAYHGVTQDEVNQLIAEPNVKSQRTEENKSGESTYNVFIEVKDLNKDLFTKTEAIAERHNISLDKVDYNTRLLAMEGIIQDDETMGAMYAFIGVLAAIIILALILVIINAFYISSSERKKYYGMLKSMGATQKQLLNSVLFEGFLLLVGGIPLGILCGWLLEVFALWVASMLGSGLFTIAIKPILTWQAIGISVLLGYHYYFFISLISSI